MAMIGLSLYACGSADRAYKGRSADAWALQLSAQKTEERIAAADAMYHIAPQSRTVVDALLRAMRDSNAEVQQSVAVALTTIGARALPGLAEAIGDDHASVRALAINLLARQGASAASALPQFVRALGDSDVAVRKEAAYALERLGPLARSAVPALVSGARSGTPDLRAACLVALAAITADTSTLLPLARVSLGDAAGVVRRAAVTSLALAHLDAQSIFSMIVPLMRDRDTAVRLEVYRVMGSLVRDARVGPTAHAALVLARADPDSSARALVQQLLSPPSTRLGDFDAKLGRSPGSIVQRRPN